MMHDAPTLAPLVGGVGLLERALGYLLGNLQMATPAVLSNATPCRDWDARALLCHVNDSLMVLIDAAECGRVDIAASAGESTADDLVTVVRNRASRALGAWTNAERSVVSVHGLPLTSPIVTGTGALEVAVHGWDLARACGTDRPIPPGLASELLSLSAMLVTGCDRPVRFAAPVEMPRSARPSDRLVAFLGRDPR